MEVASRRATSRLLEGHQEGRGRGLQFGDGVRACVTRWGKAQAVRLWNPQPEHIARSRTRHGGACQVGLARG